MVLRLPEVLRFPEALRFPELIEKKYPIKMAIGRPGTGPKTYAAYTLEAYGSSFDELEAWGSKLFPGSSSMGARAIGDGIAEAAFQVGSVPQVPINELSTRKKIKMMTVTEPDIQAKMAKIGFSYDAIPGGTYNFASQDTPTMGVPYIVIVLRSMDDQTAYDITKSMWNNKDFLMAGYQDFRNVLTPEYVQALAKDFPDQLHPGAKKYWVEQGILK